MGLLQWITNACVASCKDPLSLTLHAWRIKLKIHELVHVLQDQHIAVQLHHAVISDQAEWRQLGPAVVEARVRGVVFAFLREEIFSPLFRNPSRVQNGMSFRREGIGIESHQGVFRLVLLQTIVQSEEARKVLGVGNKCGPD